MIIPIITIIMCIIKGCINALRASHGLNRLKRGGLFVQDCSFPCATGVSIFFISLQGHALQGHALQTQDFQKNVFKDVFKGNPLEGHQTMASSTVSSAGRVAQNHVKHLPPVTLYAHNKITGPDVTLGHIFQGLSQEKSARVVGSAPEPGESYTLGLPNLHRLARQHGFDWSPESPQDHIILERNSRRVDPSEILDLIKKALQQRGCDQDMDIRLVASQHSLALPIEDTTPLDIKDFHLNGSQTAFNGQLVWKDKVLRLSGTLCPRVQVPVLKTLKVKGEIIEEQDLDFIPLPLREVGSEVILKPESLVGTAIKQTAISAQKPLRQRDVEVPPAVKRGQFVFMSFQTPYMTLKTQGKAQETGSLGDVIAVVNLDSKIMVHGKVTGPNHVEVLHQDLAPPVQGQRS